MSQRVHVAIIGAGFAGIGMAIGLKRQGELDFVVLERAPGVGGTWRDNTYPGAACDIQSDLYSFSFNPNPDWQYRYGRQPEILEYLRSTVTKFDIQSHIRVDCEVSSAQWDDGASVWRIETSTGALEATILVSAAGPLIDPVWPSIAGLESFTEPRFHSARWDHTLSLTGTRIAVIGTGASAIQFVPELQKSAARISVFQRTPAWIVPRGDRPTSRSRRNLFRRFTFLQRLSRTVIFQLAESRLVGFRSKWVGSIMEHIARRFLAHEVLNRELRAKLTPRYRIGCKRILVSSDFYRAVTQQNVEVVTESLVAIAGKTLRTADGIEREFDVLIAATGFNATEPPIARVIRNAQGVSLAEVWTPHMVAHRGTTVAGFANLFLLVGPNTALGHNSIVYIIEAQIDYVLQALQVLKSTGEAILEPRASAQDAYNDAIQRDLSRSVWVTGGCSSYYLDSQGKNTTLWPHRASSFRRSTHRFDPAEYTFGSPGLAHAGSTKTPT